MADQNGDESSHVDELSDHVLFQILNESALNSSRSTPPEGDERNDIHYQGQGESSPGLGQLPKVEQVSSLRQANLSQPPVNLTGPGAPGKKPSLGLLSLGRPTIKVENNGPDERPLTEGRKKASVVIPPYAEVRSHSAMGFIEATSCGRPAEVPKKAPPLTLPFVMNKKQKAALSLRSGHFVQKDLPLILTVLKEDLEKRPKYDPPPQTKSPKHAPLSESSGKRPRGGRKGSLSGPLSRSEPHFAARNPNGGALPLIKITPDLEAKLKERRSQQEAKVYALLHDQQLESSIETVHALGGELNTWLAMGQAREAHLERLGMRWQAQRDGLSSEAEKKETFSEEIELLSAQLEECALRKEAVLVDKVGLHVMMRRLHDSMRTDVSTLGSIRARFQKLSGSCLGLIEDIKRSHVQKEQAEADAAAIRARIIDARLDQEEMLAEERARIETQRKLLADKVATETRRRTRAQEAREESLVAAKDAAIKTTQAVFANELAKGQTKIQLIKMSAAFQRIVDATGLRDVTELVNHFKDPKERVEKWKAEKERAEERIAALKTEFAALKVVLGDFELEGYSARLRWKEFDALESKQLASELSYLRMREGVESIRYRVQEVQASLEIVANSAGISLSGVDFFTGKSVEPSPIAKPLDLRPTALSAEMFGLPPGQAFHRMIAAALATTDGAARLLGGEGLDNLDSASSHEDSKKTLRRMKSDVGSGLVYVPGPMSGIPPDTAVDITRVLRLLQLKLERLLEVAGQLEHVPVDPGLGASATRALARKKDARASEFHRLMEALEWIPPSERLPEKPKDPKEAIDKAAMTAAVCNYIAAGIAAAAILPLPRAQLEKFAARVCTESQVDGPLHYPPFNHRLYEAASKSFSGKQAAEKPDDFGSSAWAARVLLEEMRADIKLSRSMGDGHVETARRSAGKASKDLRNSGGLSRSGSGEYSAAVALAERETAARSAESSLSTTGTAAVPAAMAEPKRRANRGAPETIEEGDEEGAGAEDARAVWLAAKRKVLVSPVVLLVPGPGGPVPPVPQSPSSGPQNGFPGLRPQSPNNDRVSQDVNAEGGETSSNSEQEGNPPEEEDTSIVGARSDLVVFKKQNILHRARRLTLIEGDLEEAERKRRAEERYRKMLRSIPGLEELDRDGLKLVGVAAPGAGGATGRKSEGEPSEGEEKSSEKPHVRWT
ncbi:hypothetical protein KFL_006660030 [Klebsormidium nitens]|uniref:Uncharacterized protein n=1 Tax=Klebsormidium nitens TaxID=105231 RepID=A0A1Y1IIC9_KLENI|nr:hypothetical protein KFL_006660030 [Klebsormidium nitens]|eukprot:GAQ90640.1 hypothetical protein KFL_006660030 [Klebsormidium nitens]